MRNIKLALRTLMRTPFVTAVAIVSLSLGIGANAAIFSLFDQMLLQALPVHEPDRLVNLVAPGPKPGSTSCNQAGECDAVFSYPMFRDLQAAETGLSGIAAHVAFGANLAFRGQTRNGEGMLVSGSYFPLLGLKPALGRLLGPADDETIGAHHVAVLSHSYWDSQLGGDPDVLNQTIVVNGKSMTVVGVAPRGFSGTTLGATPQVFVPISMRGEMSPRFDGFDRRRSYWAYLFGRLKPGASIEQAANSLNAVYRPIIADVEAPLQEGMSDQTMAQFLAREVVLEPGARGQSTLHGEARLPLLLLFGITGIVLLIACANIANLLLVRGAGRRMEMAVRLSLGASRRQVLGQLLTESLVLALIGGVASLLVAHWTLSLVGSILPAEALTTLQLEIRPGVILFAGALAIATGLLFGLFPALHSTRPDLVTTLRANTGQIAGARAASIFRSGMVVSQIALSMALLIAAGLFLRSLNNIRNEDLGLQTENIVTFGVSPQLNGYEPEQSRILFQSLEEELGALPGVTGVSASVIPLLAGNNWGSDVSVEGFERGPDTDADARYNLVNAGYFRTLGIPLIAGREFTVADVLGAAPVAIVNEEFARKFGVGRDAVGRLMARGGGEALDMEIVGLVQNAKYSEVRDEVPPLFFTPYLQDEGVGSISYYVRTASDPAQLLRAVPTTVGSLDPNLPVEDLKPLPQQVRENVFMDRMISTLSAAFAALATLLAAVGLYGVLSYTVSQRTREIGVRMALGADSGRVRRMVLQQVGLMILIGGVIGVAAALGIGRAAGSLLFGLQGNDPMVIAAAAGILAGIALAAGYLPARRASRVDPIQALRYE